MTSEEKWHAVGPPYAWHRQTLSEKIKNLQVADEWYEKQKWHDAEHKVSDDLWQKLQEKNSKDIMALQNAKSRVVRARAQHVPPHVPGMLPPSAPPSCSRLLTPTSTTPPEIETPQKKQKVDIDEETLPCDLVETPHVQKLFEILF